MNRFISIDFYNIKLKEDFDVWKRKMTKICIELFLHDFRESSNGYYKIVDFSDPQSRRIIYYRFHMINNNFGLHMAEIIDNLKGKFDSLEIEDKTMVPKNYFYSNGSRKR